MSEELQKFAKKIDIKFLTKSQYTINAINRHKHLSYTLNGRIAQLATFIMNKKHAKTK